MNKRYMVSLLAVIVLFLLAYVGVSAVPATKWLFGVIIPYAAVFIFIVFFIRRIQILESLLFCLLMQKISGTFKDSVKERRQKYGSTQKSVYFSLSNLHHFLSFSLGHVLYLLI